MNEEESWGRLTPGQFEDFLTRFTDRFGAPVKSRRLAFSFWDHSRNDVDTRIRITDGKAEIMQKVGSWEKNRKWSRSEQKVSLTANTEEIFNAYQILRVLIPGEKACYIAQYENFIFQKPEFELKLTRQTGKTDRYNFEVEAKNKETDLNKVLSDLGLADLVTETDADFWHQWNRELNLNDDDLTEEEIKGLINEYCFGL